MGEARPSSHEVGRRGWKWEKATANSTGVLGASAMATGAVEEVAVDVDDGCVIVCRCV